MNAVRQNAQRSGATREILAFRLDDQEFCVKTIPIREIRGWGAATPIPTRPRILSA
jgi:purine-binding chemotaxis protein CheW